MTKIMIVVHRTEAADVLESLQQAGLVQVLNAEKAMITKQWPELHVESRRPREIEETVAQLEKAIVFLHDYAGQEPRQSIFGPRIAIKKNKYAEVVSGEQALDLLARTEVVEKEIERLSTEAENLSGRLDCLLPWADMETPVEALRELTTVSAFAGLLPHQHFEETRDALVELGAAVQQIGSAGIMHACVVGCPRVAVADVQKILRSNDFETVNFECMTGRVGDLITSCHGKLASIKQARAEAETEAAALAKDRLALQILHDHHHNLLNREVARANAPATESVVLLEGWVKRKDYRRLENLVAGFAASSVSEIQPAEGEEPPVDIENKPAIEPFEAITRLYGMPSPRDVDPTAFLAPFFALFFGLCLTDAVYGIVLVGLLWWILKKIQGDKKFIRMFLISSVLVIAAGAATGSWCGDAVDTVLPQDSAVQNAAIAVRDKLMIFNPMTNPMTFFMLSLALGYFQIICGICIALYNNLRHKDYAGAVFGQVTWLIFLNSLLVLGLSKGGILPAGLARPAGILAIIQALLIFLFTERKSGLAGRIGGGVFALFSTVFYFGDVLSYVRLMALGMVTGGLGMAINILSKLLMDSGKIGFVLGLVLFVGGHMFNMAMGVLSAFVHSLRLQFVEFFPKFFAGGGTDFTPLHQEYRHISIEQE